MVKINSMIFKTFDNNIGKISSKWGMFGRSFNDIGTAIVGRITDINKAFQATGDLVGSIKNSESIWKRLYPSKESIKEQLIDVDSLIPEIDKETFDFDHWINELNDMDKQVKAGVKSWQDYSNGLDDNQKWIAKWGQETEGQIRTQIDLVKANQQARASALAHNEAIKAQTFSAKAGKVALQALATAGNMLAGVLISMVVGKVLQSIDDYVNRVENAKEALDDFYNSAKESRNELNSQKEWIDKNGKAYEKLAEGVDEYGHTISLTADEFSEYKSMTDEIAEMFPDMVKGYNDQNQAILKNKGSVDALTEAYERNVQAYYASIRAKSSETFDDYKTEIKDKQEKVSTLGDLINNKNIDIKWLIIRMCGIKNRLKAT